MRQMRRHLYGKASGCLFILKERTENKPEWNKGAGAVTSRTLSTFLLRSPPLFSLRLAAIFPDLPIIVMSG